LPSGAVGGIRWCARGVQTLLGMLHTCPRPGPGDNHGFMHAWLGVGFDLAFVLDEAGAVRSISCQGDALWDELAGTQAWLERPWVSLSTPATRQAAEALLLEAAAGPSPAWRHVDCQVPGGGVIPLLCALARVGTDIVVYARDVRAMDFNHIVLSHDAEVASAYATSLRDRGLALETVWLDVLAPAARRPPPAARRLGDLWTEDVCTFTDVTEGLGRLQEVLRTFDMPGPLVVPAIKESRRILSAACPGEQHTFGLAMLAAFFRKAGWHVRHETNLSAADLVHAVSRTWFGVVGLSASGDRQLDALAASIQGLRRKSRNPALRIMVGGKVFTDRPELAAQVGADATAFDGRQAVHVAQRLIDTDAKRA